MGYGIKPFFQTKECNKIFKGHASGGRIQRLKENIILTVGSLDVLYGPSIEKSQSLDNAIGKVISINQKGGFEVISLGHQNQQGLLILGGCANEKSTDSSDKLGL